MATDNKIRFSLQERQSTGKGHGDSGNVIQANGVTQILDRIHEAPVEDTTVDTWAVLTYEGNSLDTLVLAGHGKDYNDVFPLLTDDIVAYVLVRVIDIVDEIPTKRFAYLSWFGDQVGGARKARIATNKTAVSGVIGHYNIEIVASSHDEITMDVIMGKISDASGSRVRVLNASQPTPSLTQNRGGGNRTPHAVVPTANQVVAFDDEAALKAALQSVRDDNDPTTWVLLGYTSNKTIGLESKGTGDFNELVSNLDEGKVLYGLRRETQTVDETTQARFIFINWIGENVSPLAKGRITSHKGVVNEFFEPFHITINAQSKDEVTSEVVEEKIQQLKGAR